MPAEKNNNSTGTPMRRHALLGWHGGRARPAPGEALQSRLPVRAVDGPGFGLAATASCSQLSGGGAVAVAGRPQFTDDAATQLAMERGAAAVVAMLYEQQGEGVFSLLRGSFCCAIADTARQRTLVGVDRLGQHALYYGQDGDTFYFGSSALEALATAGLQPRLVNQGIFHYVYFHMVPCPVSVYDGLHKIPAAHYVEHSRGESRLVNYWLPTFTGQTAGCTEADMARELRATLKSATANSLPDTGSVGSFLSGGLDSSTVTGMLAELAEREATAYAIGFSAEGYDEMPFARITARHFGVRLEEYYVTPEDVVAALPLVAASYDEPFGNSSALPAYFCARVAADQGVSTLLAGDGGDEIFAGNERYLRQRVFDHYALIPGPVRRGVIEPLARALPRGIPLVAKANSYIEQANTPLPDRLQSYNFLHRHLAGEIFSGEFLEAVDTGLPLALQRDIFQRPVDASELDRMLYLDWQITLADNDLRKVSHMCALAGVDVTFPMLDDELVEFSCRVPAAWKIRNAELRHFYKRALRDWLPAQTIAKSKQGFGLPFGVWMRTYQPLRDLAYDNLLQLKGRNIIRPEFIDRAIQMHRSEHAAYYGELVWILTVFELWLQAHPAAALARAA